MEINRWPLKICFQAIWNVILSAYRQDSTILQYILLFCSLNFLYGLSYVFIYLVLTFDRRHSNLCFCTVRYADHTHSYNVALLCYSAQYLQTRACSSAHTLSGPPCSLLPPFICIFSLFWPTYVKGENETLCYTCVISYGIWIWHTNYINEIASAQRFVIRSVLVVIYRSSLFTGTGKLSLKSLK